MAATAALAALPSIVQGATTALTAAQGLHALGSKYAPGVRKIANTAYSIPGKAKSAATYIRGLTTAKGLKKFVTKDIPSVAKKASKFISSGKAVKAVGSAAADIGQAVDLVHSVTGETSTGQAIKGAASKGAEEFAHHHEVLEKYNEAGKQLSQWQP